MSLINIVNVTKHHLLFIQILDGYKSNPKKLVMIKVSEHTPLGSSMFPLPLFKDMEINYDVCRGKDCVKISCKFLKGHTIRIIKIVNKGTAEII